MTTLPNGQAEVRIRPRTKADVPECAALLREVHALDGYPVEGVADATGWMYPASMIAAWVAEASGKVLGHVAVCGPGEDDAAVSMLIAQTGVTESEVAVLARLFVGPAARGRGVGKSLAKAAFNYATENRLRIVFDVMEKDQSAINMYEKMGCIILGATSHHVAEVGTIPARCYAAPGAAESVA